MDDDTEKKLAEIEKRLAEIENSLKHIEQEKFAEIEKRLVEIEQSFPQIESLLKQAEYDKQFGKLNKAVDGMENAFRALERAVNLIELEKKIEQNYYNLEKNLSPQAFANLGLTPPHELFGREEPPQPISPQPQPAYKSPYADWPVWEPPKPKLDVLQKDDSGHPIKIKFDTLEQAMQHAVQQEGLILKGNIHGKIEFIWYDESHYDPQKILRTEKGLEPSPQPFIATWQVYQDIILNEKYNQPSTPLEQKNEASKDRAIQAAPLDLLGEMAYDTQKKISELIKKREYCNDPVEREEVINEIYDEGTRLGKINQRIEELERTQDREEPGRSH